MRPCPATRRRPGPAAAPSTSPGPAIPRSRPARQTRNAGRRGHGRLPGAARSARPMPQAFPRPCSWAFPTPDDREPSIQHPPLQAATAGPGRTEPNVTSGSAKDPAASRGVQAERLRTGLPAAPGQGPAEIEPIPICLIRAEERPIWSRGVTSERTALSSSNCRIFGGHGRVGRSVVCVHMTHLWRAAAGPAGLHTVSGDQYPQRPRTPASS